MAKPRIVPVGVLGREPVTDTMTRTTTDPANKETIDNQRFDAIIETDDLTVGIDIANPIDWDEVEDMIMWYNEDQPDWISDGTLEILISMLRNDEEVEQNYRDEAVRSMEYIIYVNLDEMGSDWLAERISNIQRMSEIWGMHDEIQIRDIAPGRPDADVAHEVQELLVDVDGYNTLPVGEMVVIEYNGE
ncbi:hypothetical protein [Halobellus ordinarius]|uniref:hypothetical protein n=1 Tax=Halobellus ordinarius TaxID=3075120 RepID=UPI0028809E0E|nr:hypothetical protein [Halobellus sp. ZY16]